MKIAYKIEFNQKEYEFLSDNSKDLQNNEKTLFVQTPRNGEYAEEMRKNGYEVLSYTHLKNYFTFPKKIIGITGTNGKTTTANLIYYLLQNMGYKCAMLGTQGLFFQGRQLKPKGLTTPTILELYQDLDLLAKEGCEILVMEVSSHAIEQQRIYGLCFDAKILTNITGDHLDYHKNLENYIEIKNLFFQDDGLKIINREDKNAKYNPKNAYTYSLLDKQSGFYVSDYDLNSGINATLNYQGEQYKIKSLLYGLHNLYNILGALLCLEKLFALPLQELLDHLEGFLGVSGRMEVVSKEPLVIVDFAHTHDGMEKIFKSFEEREIKVVFGAGGDRDRSKRPLMGEVAQKYASKIYVTSDNPRSEEPMRIIEDILEGITNKENVVVEQDRYKAINLALQELKTNEVLLVLGKGDETYQILKDKTIDFDDREVIREIMKKI